MLLGCYSPRSLEVHASLWLLHCRSCHKDPENESLQFTSCWVSLVNVILSFKFVVPQGRPFCRILEQGQTAPTGTTTDCTTTERSEREVLVQ